MQIADLGVEMEKRWNSTGDSRTRDAHAAMDGETVPIDEPFSNGAMTTGTITPDLPTFRKLAEDRRVIPVTRTLFADGDTPVGLYRKTKVAKGPALLFNAEACGISTCAFPLFSPFPSLTHHRRSHASGNVPGTSALEQRDSLHTVSIKRREFLQLVLGVVWRR